MSKMTPIEIDFTNRFNLDTEPAYSIIEIIGKSNLLENPDLRIKILQRLADNIANNLASSPCEIDIEESHLTNMRVLPEYIGLRGNLYPYSILTREIRFIMGINDLRLISHPYVKEKFIGLKIYSDNNWDWDCNHYNSSATKIITTEEFLNDIIGLSRNQLRKEIEKAFFNYA